MAPKAKAAAPAAAAAAPKAAAPAAPAAAAAGPSKIRKPAQGKPSEFELRIAADIADVEAKVTDENVKAVLREVYFTEAKEVTSDEGKPCVVLTVPSKLLLKFREHQTHTKLVRELEKKLSGQHVVVVANRKIMAPSAASRPKSRTLTAVHEALMEDVVHPLEIVGKRTRVSRGAKLLKVLLDPKESSHYEGKLETFQTVYHKLTGKRAEFGFPVEEKA